MASDSQRPSAAELATACWTKSTYSGGGGNECVEWTRLAGRVAVRDTKAHGTDPILIFTAAGWTAFVSDLKTTDRLTDGLP